MTVPVQDAPAPSAPPETRLDEVLRRVNRIRVERGFDALYELPTACTAWDGGGCVLERAFEDLGVVVVDYRWAYGRDVAIEHGLAGFICDLDAGRYPELLSRR